MVDTIWQFILNNYMLSALWFFGVLAIIIFEIYLKVFGPKKIGISELTHMVNNNNGLVIDMRDQASFESGHIPNAEHIQASKLNSIVNQAGYNDKSLILVCNTGQTAYNSAFKIQKQGFKNIFVLKGGMTSWNTDNMPVIKN